MWCFRAMYLVWPSIFQSSLLNIIYMYIILKQYFKGRSSGDAVKISNVSVVTVFLSSVKSVGSPVCSLLLDLVRR